MPHVYPLVRHLRRVATTTARVARGMHTHPDAHRPLASPVLRPRDTGTGPPLQEIEKAFRATKKCRTPIGRGSVGRTPTCSVVRAFGLVLNVVKRCYFWDAGRTDGRTREFFGRHNEAALLVQQETHDSNFDEARITRRRNEKVHNTSLVPSWRAARGRTS